MKSCDQEGIHLIVSSWNLSCPVVKKKIYEIVS